MFPIYLFSSELDSGKVLSFAESGQENGITEMFSGAAELSISEGNSFLSELAKRVQKNFGSKLELSSLGELLWDVIDDQEAAEYQKTAVKKFFSQALNESYEQEEPSSEKQTFLKQLMMFSTGVYPASFLVVPIEVPSELIIGAVETFGGALLWLTPFRAVGTGMMVDGVRRMLNAVQEEQFESGQYLERDRADFTQDY
jgi:hypothetical protein